MNKETLKEAAEKYARKQCDDMYDNIGLTGASWGWETALDFTEGAKWQAERMYSEEDLKNAIEVSVAKALGVRSFTINEESFKQFKKK